MIGKTITNSFSFPLNLRGFISDVSPNEQALDFELYLNESPGNRFNRFYLTGVGAVDITNFWLIYLNSAANYIKKLFIETHTMNLTATSGNNTHVLSIKLYDLINSSTKLSPIIGCSFGGFKN